MTSRLLFARLHRREWPERLPRRSAEAAPTVRISPPITIKRRDVEHDLDAGGLRGIADQCVQDLATRL